MALWAFGVEDFERYGGPGQGALVVLALALAAAAQEPAPGLYDRPVLALDPGVHTARLVRADADAAGRIAVTGSDDNTVRVWSLADGTLLRTIPVPRGPGNIGKIFAVALGPDGGTIAAGGWTGAGGEPDSIFLFDRASGALTGRLAGLPNVVNHLVFSPDGTRLAAMLFGANGLRLYARDSAGDWAEQARDTQVGGDSYGAASFSDGRLATTSLDGVLRLYDRDGALLREVETGRARLRRGGEPRGWAPGRGL